MDFCVEGLGFQDPYIRYTHYAYVKKIKPDHCGRVSVVIQQVYAENHGVIRIYDLENARPSIF